KLYAVRYLPGSDVDASRVRVRLSQWTLNDTRINQRIDGAWFEAVRVPWLHILVNTRKLLHGALELREIDVSLPILRPCQRRDGTWNLEGLLADPWPGPWLEKTPPIVIQNGTIELVGCGAGPGPAGKADESRSGPPPAPGKGAGRGAAILREVSLR